jgi:hypothetical protein
LQLIALALLFWTLLHTLLHVACTYPRVVAANPERFELLMGDIYGDSQPDYRALLLARTSVLGFLILGLILVAYPLAAPCIRRSRTR